LLDIEEKIGALLPSAEEAQQKGGYRSGDTLNKLQKQKVLPTGITKHHAHQARAIHNNPAIVAKIKAQARGTETEIIADLNNGER